MNGNQTDVKNTNFADENTDLNTEFMTVENHVNYLTRKDGMEMTRNEIETSCLIF